MMNLKRIISTIIYIVLVTSSFWIPAQASQSVFYPSMDGYIEHKRPTFGNKNLNLNVSGIPGSECISYFEFLKLENPEEVVKATLALTFFDVIANYSVELYEIVSLPNYGILNDVCWDDPFTIGEKLGDIYLNTAEAQSVDYLSYIYQHTYSDVSSHVKNSSRPVWLCFAVLTYLPLSINIFQGDQSSFSHVDTEAHLTLIFSDAIPSYNLLIIVGVLSILSVSLYRTYEGKIKRRS